MLAFRVLERSEVVAQQGAEEGALHVDCPTVRRAFRVRVGLDVARSALLFVRAEACWGDNLVERPLTAADDVLRRDVERYVSELGASALGTACEGCAVLGEPLEAVGAAKLCGACALEADSEEHPGDCSCAYCARRWEAR